MGLDVVLCVEGFRLNQRPHLSTLVIAGSGIPRLRVVSCKAGTFLLYPRQMVSIINNTCERGTAVLLRRLGQLLSRGTREKTVSGEEFFKGGGEQLVHAVLLV